MQKILTGRTGRLVDIVRAELPPDSDALSAGPLTRVSLLRNMTAAGDDVRDASRSRPTAINKCVGARAGC